MVIWLWLVLSTYIIVGSHRRSYVCDWCYQHISFLVAKDGNRFMVAVINIYHCWWPEMGICLWLVLSTYTIVGGHRWSYIYHWHYQHISLLVATDGHMDVIGVINIYHCWWPYGYDWCYQHISLLVATDGHMDMIGVINIYHFWWPQMVIWLWLVLTTFIIVSGQRWAYGYDWCYQHISFSVATVGHMFMIGAINMYHWWWPQMVICSWLVLSTYIIVGGHRWSYVYDWCYQHISLLVATDGHMVMIGVINIYHCW